MGCNQIKQEGVQPQPIFECIFSQKQYLEYMIDHIINSNNFCYVLDKVLFEDIKKQLNELCWPYENKANLARLIQDYIRFSIQETFTVTQDSNKSTIQKKTKYRIEEFGHQFGEEVNDILELVELKNKDIVNTLQFYNKFDTWYFKLGVHNQIDKINSTIHQINQVAKNCQECYFFLSILLVRGCRELQQQKISVSQINRRLSQTIQYINVQTIDTPETYLPSDIMFIYHQVREQQYNKFPSKIYTKYPYKEVTLTGVGQERQKQYEQEIMKLVEDAKKQFQLFDGFFYTVCKLFKCRNFKINFKLKYREDRQGLERIKQKILFKQPNNYKKDQKLEYDSIVELREQQKKKRIQAMYQILTENQKIVLNISDLLRGRCVFQNIQNLMQATEHILNKIQKKKQKGVDVELLEIDNRLKYKTNDLVLKIRIRSTITEFQMGLAPQNQSNQSVVNEKRQNFKNTMHHKVYEIARSKMLSPISMLFDWHQKMTISYIKFLKKVFNHKNTMKTPEEIKIFQKLNNEPLIVDILQKDERSQGAGEKIPLKNDIIAILLTNKVLDLVKAEKIGQKKEDRTADFYSRIGYYDKSIEFLQMKLNSKKLSSSDIQRYNKKLAALRKEQNEKKRYHNTIHLKKLGTY